MLNLLAVAAGGAVGAVLRYGAGLLVHAPYGTLLVNILGSALIGVVMAKYATGNISEPARLFLAVGVLGGFTTFSAFSYDVLQLALRGAWAQVIIMVLASVALSLLAVWAGYAFVIKS